MDKNYRLAYYSKIPNLQIAGSAPLYPSYHSPIPAPTGSPSLLLQKDSSEKLLGGSFSDSTADFELNFIEQEAQKLRLKLYGTLAKMKILVSPSEKPKSHQTSTGILIIYSCYF